MTAPYLSDTPTALAAGELGIRATASVAGYADLPVIDADLTFDESWNPHVQGTVTLALVDPAALASMDPREGDRLQLSVGYSGPGREDVHPIADLRVRTYRRDHGARTATVQLYSGELDLQDADGANGFHPGWEAGYPIPQVITEILDAYGFTHDTPPLTPWTLDEDLQLVSGMQPWEVIRDLADRAGLWVYDTGLRHFRVTVRPDGTSSPTAELRTGPGGTLERVESFVDAGDFGNAVRVEHDGLVGWAYVQDGTHPLAPPAAPRRVVTVRRDLPPGEDPTAHAVQILPRVMARGSGMELTGAPLFYLRPGQTVSVNLSGAVTLEIVERVRFVLDGDGDHRMILSTRRPIDPDLTILSGSYGEATTGARLAAVETQVASVSSEVDAVSSRQERTLTGAETVVSPIAAGGVWVRAVTFPAGRYTVPPYVTVTLRGAQGGTANLVVRRSAVTTTGFTIYVYNAGSVANSWTGTMAVDWAAEDMS